jgi:F-type H+-transporting ATPase subunit b
MGLITPDYGLIFWMLVSFSVLLFILKKFAWKPILQGIKSREEYIAKALRDAEYARNEIAKLEERSNEMRAQAQAEKDEILAQARQTKDRIIEEANAKAQLETQKMLLNAEENIRRQSEAAQIELKTNTSKIILQATERILRKELENKSNYEEQVNSIIQELSSQN